MEDLAFLKALLRSQQLRKHTQLLINPYENLATLSEPIRQEDTQNKKS